MSKMTHLIACSITITGEGCAKLFVDRIFKHHGLPSKIVSDRDPRFTGHFMTSLATALGIRQALSTSAHPQTDGQTERMNRIVEDTLRHYVSPTQTDWDQHLSHVEFAINNSWQESLQNTPFCACYGQHPHTPTTLLIADKVPAARRWLVDYEERVAHARACILAAQDRQQQYADRKRTTAQCTVGDLVLLSTKKLAFRVGVRRSFTKV